MSGGRTMCNERLAAAGFAMLVALLPVSVHADMIWEVENARANARAGGPVSSFDKELLDRWGCLSGSPARALARAFSTSQIVSA